MVSGIQTNAFKTTSTGANFVTKIDWDENIRKHLYDSEIMRFITGANGNVLGRTDTRYLFYL